MSETWHGLLSLLDRIIFESMFNDITNWESQKVLNKCIVQAKEVASYAARFRPGYRCFCGPGSDKHGNIMKNRPSHDFVDGDWDKLALQMF